MARAFARLKGSIWTDDAHWCSLPALEQRAYLLLISQPEINNCGVLPYTIRRWSGMASDTPSGGLREAFLALQVEGFVVIDEDTEEILVRSFVKHDEVAKQPNLVKAAVRQYDGVRSPRIRVALAREYPDLFTIRAPDEKWLETEGKAPVPEDLPEGDAAGAGIRLETVGGLEETSNLQQQPERKNSLADAGWNRKQQQVAVKEPARAMAWVKHAKAQPGVRSVGAVSWTGFEGGGWPETQTPDVAHTTVTYEHACPHCSVTCKTGRLLEDHMHVQHDDAERTEPTAEIAALLGKHQTVEVAS